MILQENLPTLRRWPLPSGGEPTRTAGCTISGYHETRSKRYFQQGQANEGTGMRSKDTRFAMATFAILCALVLGATAPLADDAIHPAPVSATVVKTPPGYKPAPPTTAPEELPASPGVGRQTVAVPPGGGSVMETTFYQAGRYTFVTHALGDSTLGAMGRFIAH
jgi:hypothetical protein